MRRRWLSTRSMLASVSLLLLVVGWLAGPPLARRLIGERLRAEAEARGVRLGWGALSFRWGQGLVLRDVRLRLLAGGLAAQIDEALIELPLQGLISGQARPARIDLIGVRGRLSVRGRLALAAFAQTQAAGERPQAPRPLPPIGLRRARLEIARDGATLGVLQIEAATLRSEGPERVAEVSGRLEASASQGPALAAALDGRWHLTARMRPGDGSIRWALRGRGAPLVDLQAPDRALQIAAASGTLSARGATVHLAAHLEEVAGRLGSRQAPVAMVRLPGVEIDWTPEGSAVRVAPGGSARLWSAAGRRWSRRARALGASSPTPGGIDPIRWWWRTSLLSIGPAASIDDLDVTLVVEDRDGVEQARPLAQALRLRQDGDVVVIEGQIPSGGRFSAGAQLRLDRPGLRLLSVDLERIDLGWLREEARWLAVALGRRRHPTRPPERPDPEWRVGGQLSGRLTLETLEQGAPGARIEGRLHLEAGRLEAPAIAPAPLVDLQGDVRASIEWRPEIGELRLQALRARSGPLAVEAEASIQGWPDAPVLRARAELHEIPCQEAWRALPVALRGRYRDALLDGRLAPRLSLTLPLNAPQALALKIRDAGGRCRVLHLGAPPPSGLDVIAPRDELGDVGWLNRAFSMQVAEGVSEGATVRVGPGVGGYVPLAHLPRWVGGASYLSEEMDFWHGPAINKGLTTRAVRLNLEHGRYLYGGSTITQQLVKNLFLTRRKTLARKIQEAIVAVRVAQVIPKQRVLELYLNCIEFGPNVYGVGPASSYYFGKPASQLSPREAVFLAMLKPAPRRGAWMKARGRSPSYPFWLARAEVLFDRLVEHGLLTEAQAAAERPYTLRWDQAGRYLAGWPR